MLICQMKNSCITAEYAEMNSCFVELILICRSGFSRELSMFATKVAPTIKQYDPLRTLRLCG